MRIIKLRSGFNPNSSSLSVNMAMLLAATSISALGTLLAATAARLFSRKSQGPQAGTHAEQAPVK